MRCLRLIIEIAFAFFSILELRRSVGYLYICSLCAYVQLIGAPDIYTCGGGSCRCINLYHAYHSSLETAYESQQNPEIVWLCILIVVAWAHAHTRTTTMLRQLMVLSINTGMWTAVLAILIVAVVSQAASSRFLQYPVSDNPKDLHVSQPAYSTAVWILPYALPPLLRHHHGQPEHPGIHQRYRLQQWLLERTTNRHWRQGRERRGQSPSLRGFSDSATRESHLNSYFRLESIECLELSIRTRGMCPVWGFIPMTVSWTLLGQDMAPSKGLANWLLEITTMSWALKVLTLNV